MKDENKATKPRGIRKPKGYQSAPDPNDKSGRSKKFPWDNLWIAEHGRCSPVARMLWDCKDVAGAGLSERKVREQYQHIGEFFSGQLRKAAKKNDGGIFRELAALCDGQKSVAEDPLRKFLVQTHGAENIKAGLLMEDTSRPHFTAREFCEKLKDRKFGEYAMRYIHEVCAELGIPLKDGHGKKSNRRFSN